MKKVALSAAKDDLSRYIHLAEGEEIIITRHGKPAAVLIGFKDDDDWFDYRLERDPRFLRRIAQARGSFRQGLGIPFEDVMSDLDLTEKKQKQRLPAKRRQAVPSKKRRV